MPRLTTPFDVALSFAGEDRPYVEQVADHLQSMGIRVFYDKYEQVSLWGKDLASYLQDLYQKKSRYTVLFISKHYAKKVWTNHERRSAQARALRSNREYVLPARFDSTDIPGLLDTVGYVDLKSTTAAELALMIKAKVGPLRRTNFLPESFDLLHQEIGAHTPSSKLIAAQNAGALFRALKLMTRTERRMVAEAFRLGCPDDLPNNIHISLELLRRVARMSIPRMISMFSRLESLGLDYELYSDQHENENIERMIRLSFYPRDLSLAGNNGTLYVHGIVQVFRDRYCANHFMQHMLDCDFSPLSSLSYIAEVHD